MNEFRTDLAFEARNFYLKKNNLSDLPGISTKTVKTAAYSISEVFVESKEASRKIGKPEGKYITIHSPHLETGLFTEELSIALSKEIIKLFPEKKENPLVFIAGLGNIAVTPDSLGPKVLSSLIVTRHLPEDSKRELDLCQLCALAPGVLGITGIETAEILSAVINRIKPDLLIAIDALASRSSTHVGCTIQLSDTGLNPGSGVNNRRAALNQSTVGIPVVSIGIPTVSDVTSVIYDAMDDFCEEVCHSLPLDSKEKLIKDYIFSHCDDMMVTPKNIDAIINRTSLVLSRGINLAVHNDLNYSLISDYIS